MFWWSLNTSRIPLIVLFLPAALSVACLEVRSSDMILDGSVDDGDREDCKSCHHASDDEELTRCDICHLAEPVTDGHPAHQKGSSTEGPSGCDQCHRQPLKWFDEGHLDALVQIVFSDQSLARKGGLDPSWNGSACQNVYCHGAGMEKAVIETPPWSSTGSMTCGDCHGIPPAGSHPREAQCELCHGGGYLDDGSQDPEAHVNGSVEMATKEGSP